MVAKSNYLNWNMKPILLEHNYNIIRDQCMLKVSALLLASVFSLNSASAEDSVQDARGSTIIAAGEVEAYSCPGLGMYDCSGWPENLYRFTGQNICFTSSEPCDLDCAALLVERNGQQSILLVGARYHDSISSASGQAEECPKDFTM